MWFNPIMEGLLRSPLHKLISKQIMLVSYSGRKSGKAYTLPVNYVRDGDFLYTVSFKNRTWWRSLRGGAPVTLLVAGRQLKARAEVAEKPGEVIQGLRDIFQHSPQYAGYLSVKFDGNGAPNENDISRAAQDRW